MPRFQVQTLFSNNFERVLQMLKLLLNLMFTVFLSCLMLTNNLHTVFLSTYDVRSYFNYVFSPSGGRRNCRIRRSVAYGSSPLQRFFGAVSPRWTPPLVTRFGVIQLGLTPLKTKLPNLLYECRGSIYFDSFV